MRVVFSGWLEETKQSGHFKRVSSLKLKVLPQGAHERRYLFELENRPQGLHHGVLLVVLYQVGQGVELLASPDVVLQVLLQGEQREPFGTSLDGQNDRLRDAG